jgi:hypothetical protein
VTSASGEFGASGGDEFGFGELTFGKGGSIGSMQTFGSKTDKLMIRNLADGITASAWLWGYLRRFRRSHL